jgi:hypothetical protein
MGHQHPDGRVCQAAEKLERPILRVGMDQRHVGDPPARLGQACMLVGGVGRPVADALLGSPGPQPTAPLLDVVAFDRSVALDVDDAGLTVAGAVGLSVWIVAQERSAEPPTQPLMERVGYADQDPLRGIRIIGVGATWNPIPWIGSRQMIVRASAVMPGLHTERRRHGGVARECRRARWASYAGRHRFAAGGAMC